MDLSNFSRNRIMCNLSFSTVVGEKWYLCVIFAATLATCSLSVLPDVRASNSNLESHSLADDLEKCCVFNPPAMTNCSWMGDDNSVSLCHVRKYSDSGNLQQCYYTQQPPEKNKYPAPAKNVNAEPFNVKCLPKNGSDATTCSKFYGHYFVGLNITMELSPYTAIFTKGLMISIVGVSSTSRHLYMRWCRLFEFETNPGFNEIEKGHLFYYDGFRWLDPGAQYQVTVRTLPIEDDHINKVQQTFQLPSCSEVPNTYYCHSAANWQPRLLAVHPDWQMVNVTFDLAPEAYQFDKYCIKLKNMANNETTHEKDVIPNSESIIKKKMNGTNATCEVVSTTLGDIPPGSYVVELRPRPSQLVCRNALDSPVKCKKTGSHTFFVTGPTVGATHTTDGTQVKQTPTSSVPYTSSPVRDAQRNQIWLPILLGCIAGILALLLLFCMIQRSQKHQEESENSSKWIWKIPVKMPGHLKVSQESLQKGLDLLRLKEKEFELQQSEQNDDSDLRRQRITNELLRSRDRMELEPLLVPHQGGQGSSSRQSQLGGDNFRSGSCSSIQTGFTAEFMQVMYPQMLTRSISSLGTVDASGYRGSPSKLLRHNSKPDLVNMWWEKCPMLNAHPGALKRLANSCPNMTLLQQNDLNKNL